MTALPPQDLQVLGDDFFLTWRAAFSDAIGGIQIDADPITGHWFAEVHRDFAFFRERIVWVNPTKRFELVYDEPCFVGRVIRWTVFVYPEFFASATLSRGPKDEQHPAVPELFRWKWAVTWLPGATRLFTARRGWLWDRDHPRGDVVKVDTSTMPRAGGQLMRWEF